ncbi:MAG: hypothetical protein WCO25_05580 [Candidatus Uhrbacteria bacterium]
MLWVSDDAELKFLEADEKYKLREFLERRRYRVSDSPLTYRQINNLASVGLLRDAQSEDGKWHKFSFVELVFLKIVLELRGLGFENGQLKGLHRAFLEQRKPITTGKDGKIDTPAGYAFMAIGYAMLQMQIVLTVAPDGEVGFFSTTYFINFASKNTSFAYINVNNIVNDLLKQLGHNASIPYKTFIDLYADVLVGKDKLTDKERKLVELVRSGDYTTVRVHKKDDKTWVVHGKKEADGKGVGPLELLKTIEKRDYQDITIQTRGGKVSHFSVEDVMKM